MGASGSADEWQGYGAQLLKDSKPQTIAVPDSEEKGTTPIYRNKAAEKGFQKFLTDEDLKVEMDSGWECARVAFDKYPEQKCFGYRPFTDADKDPLQRGTYEFDTYGDIKKQVYAAGNGKFHACCNCNCDSAACKDIKPTCDIVRSSGIGTGREGEYRHLQH